MTRLWFLIPALLIAAGLFLVSPGPFARAKDGPGIGLRPFKDDQRSAKKTKKVEEAKKSDIKLQDILISGKAKEAAKDKGTKKR